VLTISVGATLHSRARVSRSFPHPRHSPGLVGALFGMSFSFAMRPHVKLVGCSLTLAEYSVRCRHRLARTGPAMVLLGSSSAVIASICMLTSRFGVGTESFIASL